MASAKKFPIKPLGDRVVIRPLEKQGEKKLASGIILPEAAGKEQAMRGEVVAVGAGKVEEGKLVAMTVKVGDKVICSNYGYDELKVDGEEYLILSESSILAVIN